MTHGGDACPQFHLKTFDLEIVVRQAMKRMVELHEDFPKHPLALKHFAVKFQAFAAIDIQCLERRVR